MSDSACTGELPASESGAANRFLAAPPLSATLSISVFHAPQLGHLPSHLGQVPPHSEQVNRVLSLAMGDFTGFIASLFCVFRCNSRPGRVRAQ